MSLNSATTTSLAQPQVISQQRPGSQLEWTQHAAILNQWLQYLANLAGGVRQTIPWAATVNINANSGLLVKLVVSSTSAFTIANPTGLTDGMELVLFLSATVTPGAITWGSMFKQPTLTIPANGYNTTLKWRYDAKAGYLYFESQGSATVPN
jgi:hypothetical protein